MNKSVPVAAPKAAGASLPEVARIRRATLEVQHAVIFGDDVQIPAATRDANELRERSVGIRNRVDDVSADGKIEAAIGDLQVEYAPMLERESRGEMRKARARKLEMRIDDVDTEHVR